MSKAVEVFETEGLLRKVSLKPKDILTGQCCAKIPFRTWIALMVFLTTYVNYTTRVNMAISIVPMTGGRYKPTPECLRKGNESIEATTLAEAINSTLAITAETTTKLPDYGPRYDWNQHIQGTILGAYFYGYVVSSLFGGWLSETIGPHHVIFWTHAIIALCNSASTYCYYTTTLGFIPLIILRIIIGTCAGFVYPALQTLIAKWAPPAEKGKFVSCLMGNTLGTCVTWPLVGTITMATGWDWGFHVVTLQNIIFCVIFWIVAADTPDKSRFIREEEVAHIAEAQGGSVSKKKGIPPFKALLGSFPFWMLAVLHFGNLWGLYVQLQTVPKFMAEVVGFNLKNAGGLAALPHLMRLFTGMFFGNLEDFLKSRNIASTLFIRKFFVLFSHILPGVLLMMIVLARCSAPWNVAFLVLSMALNGAATITNLRNPQDLAPNFAGTIFGIISFIGGLTGFIVPAILGALTESNNGLKEWSYHFIIGGSMYVICGVIFMIFGSVNLQPWNEIKEKEPAG